jgi:lipopolysaccharide transport system ATP-binding protein
MPQRTFVVVRDPRDTLVSWYYSLRYSHGDDWKTVPEVRRILEEANSEDGMAILLRGELYDAVNIQMTWLEAGARMFRYEDLLRDELAGFREILKFCEIEVGEERLREIVAKHSFERRSGRKRGDADPKAVMRKGEAGDWRNHFSGRFERMFRTLFGEATVRMGYAPPGPEKW